MSQCIFLILILSCVFWLNMCFLQVNLKSKYSPRYFTWSAYGNLFLLKFTTGQLFIFIRNVTFTDMDLFVFIPQFSSHDWTLLWLSCSIFFASCDATIAVLSVMMATIVFFVYNRYNTGPSMLPWGTPEFIINCYSFFIILYQRVPLNNNEAGLFLFYVLANNGKTLCNV